MILLDSKACDRARIARDVRFDGRFFIGVLTLIERVRVIFDLNADPRPITRQLGAEPALIPLLRRTPGVRLPGAWDGFEVAVHRLVARDVGPARAASVMARLADLYGWPLAPRPPRGLAQLFPRPEALATIDETASWLSRRGAQHVRQLAQVTAAGAIRFDLTISCETLSVGSIKAPLGPVPGRRFPPARPGSAAD